MKWRLTARRSKVSVWTFKTLPVIAITDPNLVGWWTLDEGRGTRAVDWSGHGHHADFMGRRRWTEGTTGPPWPVLPSGQYLEASGYPGVLGKQDRTAAAWIKTTTIGDIMGWGLATNTQKWIFRVQTDNGNPGSIRVEVQGGRICGWTDVRDGEWHHVAAVLKSAGAPTVLNIRLYVDGVQEADQRLAGPSTSTRSAALATSGSATRIRLGPFPGLLDDVRIYDKALTQEELERVMRIDPLRAWGPQPATGSIVDIRMATPLTWTDGDNASKHDVYFGTDAAAVAAADCPDTTGIYRGRLECDQLHPGGRPRVGTEVLLAGR